MDPIPPYSLAADWLSKFHTWPEPIQALWLVAGCATLLGASWLGFRALREIAGLVAGLLAGFLPGARAEPGEREGEGSLVYGIYRDRRGRWMVYLQGRGVRELVRPAGEAGSANPPPTGWPTSWRVPRHTPSPVPAAHPPGAAVRALRAVPEAEGRGKPIPEG